MMVKRIVKLIADYCCMTKIYVDRTSDQLNLRFVAFLTSSNAVYTHRSVTACVAMNDTLLLTKLSEPGGSAQSFTLQQRATIGSCPRHPQAFHSLLQRCVYCYIHSELYFLCFWLRSPAPNTTMPQMQMFACINTNFNKESIT